MAIFGPTWRRIAAASACVSPAFCTSTTTPAISKDPLISPRESTPTRAAGMAPGLPGTFAARTCIWPANNPTAGPDTADLTTLYTVINHPDPQNYPGYPAEYGRTVNGFQDDFTGATRDPNWKAIGPGGDHYVQEDGVLKVYVATNDPNHF